MGLRFRILITDEVTGETVVNRYCDRFSFTFHHRRRVDLPTHVVVGTVFEDSEKDISSVSKGDV